MKLTALYKYAFCALLALVGAAGLEAKSDHGFTITVLPSVEIIPGKLVRRETRYDLEKDDACGNLCSYTLIEFRTLNGQACEIRVERDKSSFNDCGAHWPNHWAFAPRDGKWGGNMRVTSTKYGKAGASYSYELSYKLEWK